LATIGEFQAVDTGAAGFADAAGFAAGVPAAAVGVPAAAGALPAFSGGEVGGGASPGSGFGGVPGGGTPPGSPDLASDGTEPEVVAFTPPRGTVLSAVGLGAASGGDEAGGLVSSGIGVDGANLRR